MQNPTSNNLAWDFFCELYLINTNQLFHISIIPEIIIKCRNEMMKHISKIKLTWSYFDIQNANV